MEDLFVFLALSSPEAEPISGETPLFLETSSSEALSELILL